MTDRPGPSLASELKRSFLPFNLAVAAATGAAAGLAALLITGSAELGALAGAAVLALVTLLHASAHAYFGWRFGRGLRASARGDHARARRLLAPVVRLGHYDPDGVARAALERERA
jgi:hypothetical protein